MSRASLERVRRYFDSIKPSEVAEQKKYWIQQYPKSNQEVRNRWLFAFASVHTNWQNNVKQYESVKDKPLCDYGKVLSRLKNSGGGMHGSKAQGIMHFGALWRYDNTRFTQKPTDWVANRNANAEELRSINKTKCSFADELCWPLETESVCLDVHMLRLMGLPDKALTCSIYDKIEKYWNKLAKAKDIPAFIARCIYWDRQNNQPNSHYWAHIL